MADEAPERVDEGRQDDGLRGVDVPVHLGTGPGEVKNGFSGVDVDGDGEADPRAVVHEVFGSEDALAGRVEGSTPELLQHLANGDFGVALLVRELV